MLQNILVTKFFQFRVLRLFVLLVIRLVLLLSCCSACPAMTEWYPNWERNNWKGSYGQCIKNLDDFKRLKELSAQVEIKWVSFFCYEKNLCKCVECVCVCVYVILFTLHWMILARELCGGNSFESSLSAHYITARNEIIVSGLLSWNSYFIYSSDVMCAGSCQGFING